MPQIAELKEIDGEIWARVGIAGQFESGIGLYTPDERRKEFVDAYVLGYEDAKNGEEKNP